VVLRRVGYEVDDPPGDTVVAPGASRRSQLVEHDDYDAEPPHPVETLAAALV
jgi:hypothetical protein